METSADHAVDAAVRCAISSERFAELFRHPVEYVGGAYTERRLNEAQQAAVVSELARKSLHVFLERYGMLLGDAEVRPLLGHPNASVPEVRFWLDRLLRQPLTGAALNRRNRGRRWSFFRQELLRADGFFSEEEMKRRDPRLFHMLCGQSPAAAVATTPKTAESLKDCILERLEREMDASALAAARARAQRAQIPPFGGAAGADPLLDGAASGAGDAMQVDFWDFGSESEDSFVDGIQEIAGDLAPRKARLLHVMRERFIDGEEVGYDYARIDEDSGLDDLEELSRDAEERYFDED